MITDPARLDWDPGWKFPTNHACRAARRMNQTKKQGSGEPTAYAHYTVSCIVSQFARESFGICSFRGSCMGEYDLFSKSQFVPTRKHTNLGCGSLQAKRCPYRESFGICGFRGSCMGEYDLIWLTQGIFKITAKQFAREDFGFSPLT